MMYSTASQNGDRMTADRDAYRHYVDSVLEEWAQYSRQRDHWTPEQMPAHEVDDVWDAVALQKAGRGFLSPRDAFAGPWRNVAPYLSNGFREWLEYNRKRLTFSEFRAARVAERKEAATERAEYVESAEFCLDRLETWAELNRQRDNWIVQARERGATFKQLTDATGLTRMALHNVIERDRRAQFQRVIAEAESITADASEYVVYDGELVEVF